MNRPPAINSRTIIIGLVIALPQWGHFAAPVLMSFPHSLHLTIAMRYSPYFMFSPNVALSLRRGFRADSEECVVLALLLLFPPSDK
jgi:hypothetical protein